MDIVADYEAHDFKSALWLTKYQQLGRHQPQMYEEPRHEEPMDISAMGPSHKYQPSKKFGPPPPNNGSSPSSSPYDAIVARQDKMDRQMEGLQSTLTKLFALQLEEKEARKAAENGSTHPNSARPKSNRPINKPSRQNGLQTQYLEEGIPVCSYCHKVGHHIIDCRKKKRQDDRKQQRHQEN